MPRPSAHEVTYSNNNKQSCSLKSISYIVRSIASETCATPPHGSSTGRGVVLAAAVRYGRGRVHAQAQAAAATDEKRRPVPMDRRTASKNVQW